MADGSLGEISSREQERKVVLLKIPAPQKQKSTHTAHGDKNQPNGHGQQAATAGTEKQ